MPQTNTPPDFAALLATATTDPGTISAAYRPSTTVRVLGHLGQKRHYG